MSESTEDPRNDCSDCLAFEPDDAGDFGRCRRYAPVPVVGHARATWPRVRADEWCLEHRRSTAPFDLTFGSGAPAREDA